jgi:putative DNA primase/helicase
MHELREWSTPELEEWTETTGDAITALRLALHFTGYEPIPLNGKKPRLSGWQNGFNSDDIRSWQQRRDETNTGALCRNMPTFDADILDEAAAIAVEQLLRQRFAGRGKLLKRTGRAPKFAVPFRTTTPFPKYEVTLIGPDGQGAKIEMLGNGQQLAVDGIHPDTNKPYSWDGGRPGEVRRDELIEINQAEAQQTVDDAVNLLTEHHGYTQASRSKPGEKASESNLILNVLDGLALHDSLRVLAAKYVVQGKSEQEAEQMLRRLMQSSNTARDDRFRDRLNSISRLVKSAAKESGEWETADAKTGDAPPFSEEQLAKEFVSRYGIDFQYTKSRDWLHWDGNRWCADDRRRVFSRARVVSRKFAQIANKTPLRRTLASAETRAAIVSLAQDDLAAGVDQWDTNRWLLNTPGGTVDLKTGQLQPHQRTHYITKITAAAPDANCPTLLWTAFLDRVTAGDRELQAYLQRVCGYCLTGLTNEHALFFLYGTGGNGKSTFVSTITGIANDYHRVVSTEVLMWSRNERHPTELAGLAGARIASAIEAGKGRGWDEPKLMKLTGGDEITARFMHQDFFDFMPQFKLMIAGNHKPGLRSINEAIRRRLHLVPFTVTIAKEERDQQLGDKLKAEWPGILAWMIDGCLVWQQIGLAPPAAVIEATDKYLEAQDLLAQFLDEFCEIDKRFTEQSSKLYQCWQTFCETAGEKPGSRSGFKEALEQKDFKYDRSERARAFRGLKLKEGTMGAGVKY